MEYLCPGESWSFTTSSASLWKASTDKCWIPPSIPNLMAKPNRVPPFTDDIYFKKTLYSNVLANNSPFLLSIPLTKRLWDQVRRWVHAVRVLALVHERKSQFALVLGDGNGPLQGQNTLADRVTS